jgi:hypothetical protein
MEGKGEEGRGRNEKRRRERGFNALVLRFISC